MERVGIRELRQNLSVYLEQVKEGVTFEVTDRGTPVAVLAPVGGRLSRIEMLEAQGRLQRATATLESLPRPLPMDPDRPYAATEALMADREGKE